MTAAQAKQAMGVLPGDPPPAAPSASAVIAAASANADAAQRSAQATTLDRMHRPSVSGNASGAQAQREREAADQARIRAAQVARFGG
jgi:hypothetical protein